MSAHHPSRRGILSGAAALASGLAAGTGPAQAAAPMLGTQVAPWYRFKVGEFEATVVSDGPLAIGPPADAFSGAPKEQLERDLSENFLAPDNLVLEQNALVVNTGRQLVLFDTGLGGLKLFGPTTGRLLANLKLAGIEPSQIDAVVLTHAHADHCFALIGETGQPNFPNARVFLAQADFDFWTDESKASGALKPFVEGARANLLPLRDRTTFVTDGKEVVPGVTALSAPGHTVGHTIYRVDSGRETVMFTGDISHHHVLLLKRPKLEFAYDTDPQLAARSRIRVLDMLATDRVAFVSYHFPFPGVGHVAKAGEGYVWHPSPIKTLL